MRRTKLYTVMVVPHRGARMRSFAISRPFAVTLGLLLLVLGAGGATVPHWILGIHAQEERLQTLRQYSAGLQRDLQTVDLQVAELRGRIEHYEREARKFALLAGLDSLPEEMQAAGGPDGAAAPVGRIESLHEELEALNSREARLTRNFEALADAYKARGEYLASMPTVSPVAEGYFGSAYGWRRDPFTGQRSFHRGQDIVAHTGTPVVAPAGGKVTRVGRVGGLGLSVYLSHGQEIVSRFGHLSKVMVKGGARVERGQVIGYVGSTGRSMGSHLHYEILVAGKHRDPRDFILEDPEPPSN